MWSKKIIASVVLALCLSLAVGVYAGLRLSNILTATWNVVSTESELELSWNPSPDGSNFDRGSWHGNYGVRLQNLGTSTYNNVLVGFRIDAGATMAENSIRLQYFDGVNWLDLPLSGWGTSSLSGTFGPPSGFPVGPGYDVTTYIRIMFEGNASLTNYASYIEADQI